jgi:hypothetical protein
MNKHEMMHFIGKNRNKTTNDIEDDFFFDDILDPHVRIVGRKEDVLRVKDKIMAVLDAKVSDFPIDAIFVNF